MTRPILEYAAVIWFSYKKKIAETRKDTKNGSQNSARSVLPSAIQERIKGNEPIATSGEKKKRFD